MLHQQLADTKPRSKKPKTSHSSRPQLQLAAMQLDDIVSPFFTMGHQWQKFLTRDGTAIFVFLWSHRRQSHAISPPSDLDGATYK